MVATCNSPSWPYTRTIYSAWKYRGSFDGRVWAGAIYGDTYNCHVTKASVGVK